MMRISSFSLQFPLISSFSLHFLSVSSSFPHSLFISSQPGCKAATIRAALHLHTTGCPKKSDFQNVEAQKSWAKLSAVRPWTWLGSAWSRLFLVRNDPKNIFRHRLAKSSSEECRLLMTEQVHRVSSSTLKVTLGHPVRAKNQRPSSLTTKFLNFWSKS